MPRESRKACFLLPFWTSPLRVCSPFQESLPTGPSNQVTATSEPVPFDTRAVSHRPPRATPRRPAPPCAALRQHGVTDASHVFVIPKQIPTLSTAFSSRNPHCKHQLANQRIRFLSYLRLQRVLLASRHGACCTACSNPLARQAMHGLRYRIQEIPEPMPHLTQARATVAVLSNERRSRRRDVEPSSLDANAPGLDSIPFPLFPIYARRGMV
jgi:hypothetical protein